MFPRRRSKRNKLEGSGLTRTFTDEFGDGLFEFEDAQGEKKVKVFVMDPSKGTGHTCLAVHVGNPVKSHAHEVVVDTNPCTADGVPLKGEAAVVDHDRKAQIAEHMAAIVLILTEEDK